MAITADAFTDDDLAALSASFEQSTPAEIIGWASETFGPGLAVAASMEDAVLIDVASKVRPGIDVVFVTSGIHAREYDAGGAPDQVRLTAFLDGHGYATVASIQRLR